MKEEMIVRRLGAADYDEALDFLNMVYSMAGRPHDFLRALPRMWARDDAHMGKHIAVIRAGKIRSMLGVYPLPVLSEELGPGDRRAAGRADEAGVCMRDA